MIFVYNECSATKGIVFLFSSFQFPEIDGKELKVKLDKDGKLGGFEDSSGKFMFLAQFCLCSFILKIFLLLISSVCLFAFCFLLFRVNTLLPSFGFDR